MNTPRRRWLAAAFALLLLCSMTLTVLAAEYYIDDGNIEITDTQVKQEGKDAASHEGSVTISQRDKGVVTFNNVSVKTENNDVNVVLKDVTIQGFEGAPVSVDRGEGTTVTVELDGENKLISDKNNAALQVSGEGDLVIEDKDGNGTLNAISYGVQGAGIGGGEGQDGSNITINGGTVNATGGEFGAGIGGGSDGSAENITINGGTVTAIGGEAGGSGIGAGRSGTQSVASDGITINGGTVDAKGGGSGIGGGDATNITITDGTVTAVGRDGAGIGGTYNCVGDNITISGGTVDASSTDKGSGIGSGFGVKGGDIVIEGDAVVTAKANTVEYMGPVISPPEDIGSGQNAEPSGYDSTGLTENGSVNGVPGTAKEPDVVEKQTGYTRYSRGRLVTNTGAVKKVLFAFGEDWEETLEDGVLTITAPADAELKITVYAMNVLLGRNIDQIVFGGKTLALRDLVKGQTAKTEYVVSAGKLTLDGKEV